MLENRNEHNHEKSHKNNNKLVYIVKGFSNNPKISVGMIQFNISQTQIKGVRLGVKGKGALDFL